MRAIIQIQHQPVQNQQPIDYSIKTRSKEDGYGLSEARYAKGYSLRKSLSSMTQNTLEWIKKNPDKLLPASSKGEPIKILSIGCGDGELDMALLEALSTFRSIDYYGWDQNKAELALFETRLNQSTLIRDSDIRVQLEETLFNEATETEGNYDLIIMSHMLYYFKKPEDIIRRACQQLSKKGQLMIVHQCAEGIPVIRETLFKQYGIGTLPQPSQLIKHFLLNSDLPFTTFKVNAKLDVSSLITKEISPDALLLMAFCLSEELQLMPEKMLNIIKQEFFKSTHFSFSPFQAAIAEPIDIMLVSPA